VAGSSQRRALGGLFLVLALAFAGIAIAAGAAGQWVILAAAAAIGLWLGGLAVRALRP
jgi:formate hydrogenlyase subunit 3/multisubunit Na+/H+ antiporter MnhD subunit